MNVKIGTMVLNSFSGNNCFEFSALVLCSADDEQYKQVGEEEY
jgi:hypothetical protein